MSSDGRWCFVTLRVVPKARLLKVRWSLLKERLEDICPSAVPSLLPQQDRTVQSTRMLLLQVCSKDRTGLLNGMFSPYFAILGYCLCFNFPRLSGSLTYRGKNVMVMCLSYMLTSLRYLYLHADVAQKLWELEFTIHKVKISTSPDGKAVNLFFVTDNRYSVFAKTLY